ncbi:unnamed protein product [Phytophthora fragariaefolia]|uniref:Unnamed protein product n=1 Tax=Phytophthora fragariaefolia TaxID=1490495 RepID=A0A9W7D280_9STRA|nr:unnamed protein product [Phytophthora fragariaefolia]
MLAKEYIQTDVGQTELVSLLSEAARRSLFQTAVTRELKMGESLFSADYGKDSSVTAFAIVRSGSLNIHCVEYSDTTTDVGVANSSQTTSVPRGAIATLVRGQTFGDQMVALGHPSIWISNPRRRRHVTTRFKVVAGDSSTEVLLITREQYDLSLREDHLRLSYTPIFGMTRFLHPTAALVTAIECRDIFQITRRLLTDPTLSKFFFQFPPIVLERLCHHMEVQHFESHGVLLEAGSAIESVYVVVTGCLRSHRFQGSGSDGTSGSKTLVHQSSARQLSSSQEVHFIPGDAFGARELMKHCYTFDAAVLVDAETTLLCITRSSFDRWVCPMRHNTIVKPGSILQPLVCNSKSSSASPRLSRSAYYSSAAKGTRRQSGPAVFSSEVIQLDRANIHRLDEAAILLKRFGLFQTLPRFLLAQMLAQASLHSKTAGEELFHEGDNYRALVVILSGFVSFYSIENMSATVDMFQKHPFCIYSTFSGSTTNPEDFVIERRADETDLVTSVGLKHRSAMHGIHIQTLPPRNAFRTGVLEECTACPATVLAQTDCEYILFDEKIYARLLAEHTPAVDMSGYLRHPEVLVTPMPSISAPASESGLVQQTPKQNVIQRDCQAGVISPNLMSYLEAAAIPWLPSASAKKKLLLRSMVHKHLAPGQRLLKHNEILNQLVFIVSGKLAVYVHESKEVASILNASQRSVQSVALEQNVASNYGTTSRQLYEERDNSLSSRKALQRKIERISEVEPTGTRTNSRFTDFVMHAAKEAKTRQSNKKDSHHQITPNSPTGARHTLHSMVNKVRFQRTSGDISVSSTGSERSDSSKALFMLHLGPGDIYGDEITAPNGIFRSFHDVYADTSLAGSSGFRKMANDRPHAVPQGTEILCLDRQVLHSILAKTEEEAESELIGKSSNAKAKWQLASKKFFKRASHSMVDETGGCLKVSKAPKLFDFFKNILNQRRFLTMGTLAHFPQLRDLSEDARRELCLNARFEALDRHTDVYKSNGDANGAGRRFFLLITGRIHLIANGPNSHNIISQSTNSSDSNLREVGAADGFGEFEILVPESPVYTAAIAAEPTKLLSIPADVFMRHWTSTQDTLDNIEYLRSKISSFESLDLERIAIRQFVNLTKTDFRFDPCDDERLNPREDKLGPRKNPKAIKVFATVTDIGVGHVFWIDNNYHPINLIATSATVTIASISVDKLKAIMPRALLVGLENLSDQLRELYAQQYQLAKRVTATVMNEKLAARNQRLPAIQPSTDNSQQSFDSVLSRVRAGSPQNRRVHSDTDKSLNITRGGVIKTSSDVQHQVERYDIPSEVSATNLLGSFLQAGINASDFDDQPEPAQTLKQEECVSAQVATKSSTALANQSPNLLRLDVKVPLASRLQDSSPSSRSSTTDSAATCSTEWRRRTLKSGRGVGGWPMDIETDISSNQYPGVYEVDVRARVLAQMCAMESPLRAMRLEPSGTPISSLGKYFTDSPSPFFRPGEYYHRQQGLLHNPPTPPTQARTKATKSFRSNAKQVQAVLPLNAPSHVALTRKQGFLTTLRLKNALPFDDDGRGVLEEILPRVHQGRRFFYSLVDSELREYADTIALNKLSQTPCLRRYNLHNRRRSCMVSDVPVASGQAEAMLRQSFLLVIDDSRQLLLTAASASDKHKWVTELSEACIHGDSVYLSPRPIAAASPVEPAALAAVINAFKSKVKERKQSVLVPNPKPDDALCVEYRFS